MTTDDINRAFCILDTEPLYGYYPHNSPDFQGRIFPTRRQVNYFVEAEIGSDHTLRGTDLPKPVSWMAHSPAVGGAQPQTSGNPPAVTKDPEESSALKSVVGRPSTSALETVLTTQSITNGRQQTQQFVKQALLGCWSMGLHTDDVSEHAYNWFRVRNLSQLYSFADHLPFQDRVCTKMEEEGEGMWVNWDDVPKSYAD